ncbi:MAG TPA: hypothetical protein VFC00_00220 [Micromonosporaceae bacterium]|nr:hypothetical protein [Micromonosporaceae bacterium]
MTADNMPHNQSKNRRGTLRRLVNVGFYSVVRGAGTAIGGALITVLIWWITRR